MTFNIVLLGRPHAPVTPVLQERLRAVDGTMFLLLPR